MLSLGIVDPSREVDNMALLVESSLESYGGIIGRAGSYTGLGVSMFVVGTFDGDLPRSRRRDPEWEPRWLDIARDASVRGSGFPRSRIPCTSDPPVYRSVWVGMTDDGTPGDLFDEESGS